MQQPAEPTRTVALPLDAILCGDNASILAGWPDHSVDLIVTSPPYNCGKDYGTISDRVPWGDYWRQTAVWLQQSHRVLGQGGRLSVNLPWWMEKKPRRDVPYEFKRQALQAGFLFLDKIIWIKGDAGNVHTSGGYGGGGSGWGTYLSPSGPSIRCATEPILVFAKGRRGRRRLSGAGRGACIRGDMTQEEWMAWTVDAWFVRGDSDPAHPAVFPLAIPRRLIKLYTYPGEVVLDPHNGRGTTTTAAKQLGRHWIGIDANPDYCRQARQWLERTDVEMLHPA